jgi:hypothetical protein
MCCCALCDTGLRGQAAPERPLRVIRLHEPNALKILRTAVEEGETIVVVLITENVEILLEPCIARRVERQGAREVMRVGERDVDYNEHFRLILQTELPNPHFKAEVQVTPRRWCSSVDSYRSQSGEDKNAPLLAP